MWIGLTLAMTGVMEIDGNLRGPMDSNGAKCDERLVKLQDKLKAVPECLASYQTCHLCSHN